MFSPGFSLKQALSQFLPYGHNLTFRDATSAEQEYTVLKSTLCQEQKFFLRADGGCVAEKLPVGAGSALKGEIAMVTSYFSLHSQIL